MYGFSLYIISRLNDELFQPITFRVKEESELNTAPKKLIKEKKQLVIANKYNKITSITTLYEQHIQSVILKDYFQLKFSYSF